MAKSNKPKPVQKTRKKKAVSQIKDWLTPLNDFITTHSRKVTVLIFILSLILSAIYYFQGRNSPLQSLYKWENSDMAFFHEWANQV
jgi:hypothetical protein